MQNHLENIFIAKLTIYIRKTKLKQPKKKIKNKYVTMCAGAAVVTAGTMAAALGRSRAALAALERNTLDATALRPPKPANDTRHSPVSCKGAARCSVVSAPSTPAPPRQPLCRHRRRHLRRAAALGRRRTLYYTTTADFDRLMLCTLASCKIGVVIRTLRCQIKE